MNIKEHAEISPKKKRMPSVRQIRLRSGGFAYVDKEDAKKVAGYKWTCMNGKGAAAFFKDQTVLMHNLIVPYRQVSFKNGNKLDCRKENLVETKDWPSAKRKSASGNVTVSSSHPFFIVQRNVVEDGVRYQWNTKVSFREVTRTREEAHKIARMKAGWIYALSRGEFIQFVKEGKRKKKPQKRVD